MRVASMVNSVVDFPGRPSVTVFLSGCDFRCPYCHNADIIDASTGRPWGAATQEELRSRASLASVLVISGGEPTIHGEKLVDLARLGRSLGLAVGLHTNGSRPDVLKRLVDERLLDWVGLDVKGGPATYARFAGSHRVLLSVMRSASLLREAGVPLETRTVCHPDLLSPREIVQAMVAGGDPANHVLRHARATEGTLIPFRDASYSEEESARFRHEAILTKKLIERTIKCA